MNHLTPVSSLVGGALIGASAVLLWAGMGRLAGISHIVLGALQGWLRQEPTAQWYWRVLFLAGLIGATSAYFGFTHQAVHERTHVSPVLLVVGGLLVGYGTALGNGCTSGHGVCGLARLSRRSLVATLTFMFTGALTVFTVRHLLGF